MNKRKLSLPILLVLASVVAAPANAGAAVPKLAGTWEIVGTPDPTVCGPAGPFATLTNISREGAIVNVDPAVGVGVGNSYRAGKNNYVVGFFGYITPAPGVLLRYEVQGSAQLSNPGEFVGRFRTTVTDSGGIIPDCVFEGDIVAQRLVPMPY